MIMREQPMLLIKKDEQDRVTAMDSTAYIQDTDGWTGVESMCGEQYRHAMSAFRLPIARPDGVYCYKYVDGSVQERTQKEMDADYAPPEETPTQLDRIEAQCLYTALMTDTMI